MSRRHLVGSNGLTFLGTPPSGVEPRELALRKCVIAILPSLADSTDDGCERDIDEVVVLTRLSGVSLDEVIDAARALLDDPRFRSQVRRVEHALYSRTMLAGSEVADLMS